MTASVIGIALSLPAAFMLLLEDARGLTGGWEGQTRASLFLQRSLPVGEQNALAERIGERPEVREVTRVSRQEALAEFKAQADFDGALDLLKDNPLPPVLLVRPVATLQPEAVVALVDELGTYPEVARTRLDQQWLKRLQGLLALGERGVHVIAALLALTVVLVVGNTIRLDIENRREEIVITKLIGGTDAFVRRPFLYSGLCYGLVGGGLSAVLVTAGQMLISAPVQRLAGLYASEFQLTGLDGGAALTLLLGGGLLGLLGSWLAVTRHLAAIEPR